MTTERHQPPLFEKENSRYDIVPPLGTKCPFDIFFRSYKHNCMQRDFLYLCRDVENFFSMSDIRSDKLGKFARPNENMPDRI